MFTLNCKHCGKEFQTTDKRKIYCTQHCSWNAQNAKRLAKGIKYQERACSVCGKMFVPLQKRGIGRTTCSDECWSKHRSEWRNLKRATTASWTQKEIRNRLKKKYDLTPEQYDELLNQQNEKCAICGKEDSAKRAGGKLRQPLVVDHCHTTGKVRGLLCSHCNRALGFLNDDPNLLQKAADYLQCQIGRAHV